MKKRILLMNQLYDVKKALGNSNKKDIITSLIDALDIFKPYNLIATKEIIELIFMIFL